MKNVIQCPGPEGHGLQISTQSPIISAFPYPWPYSGNAQPHLRAFAGGACQREPAPQPLGALTHSYQAVVLSVRRVEYGRIEAAPVVFDFHLQAVAAGAQRDRDMLRRRVP